MHHAYDGPDPLTLAAKPMSDKDGTIVCMYGVGYSGTDRLKSGLAKPMVDL